MYTTLDTLKGAQEATEAYITKLFDDTNMCAIHAKHSVGDRVHRLSPTARASPFCPHQAQARLARGLGPDGKT